MTDVDRGSNKEMYLSSSKRSGFEQKSGLSSLKPSGSTKRSFSFQGGRKIDAEHVVIPGNKVKTQTIVHELNPRNQEALDENSMREILQEIKERGVDTEGIAVKREGLYHLIEGSRRRYCCIQLEVDMPLWVLPDNLSNKDVLAIIRAAQSSRKFSYREVGMQYIELMNKNNLKTNEQLAQYLNLSTESVRKRIQAAQIDSRLITLFPDCEGIPNNFYSRLAKIQSKAKKEAIEIQELSDEVCNNYKGKAILDIQKAQRDILEEISTTLDLFADKEKPKAAWNTSDLITFENKDQYARISRSGNGRKVRIEFNRLNQDLVDEIERLIKLKLSRN